MDTRRAQRRRDSSVWLCVRGGRGVVSERADRTEAGGGRALGGHARSGGRVRDPNGRL